MSMPNSQAHEIKQIYYLEPVNCGGLQPMEIAAGAIQPGAPQSPGLVGLQDNAVCL
jgi:hypothetical protein